MSDFLISVTAGKASGKTTVLNTIVEALADAGLMSVADTRYITLHPDKFLGHARITNLENIEQIDITLDSASIRNQAEALRSMRAGEYQAVEVDDEPRMVSQIDIDRSLLDTLSSDGQRGIIRDTVMMHVNAMLDEAFDGHGGFIPTTINVDVI